MGHRLSQRFERRTPVGGSLYSFNGSFANLFAQFNGPGSVLQAVQTDLGLTYGGTLLATGTTPPVITLTGTLTGAVTGFTITVTLPGILGTWTGLVTYLIDGSTQAFTSAATVPLTGRGAGLTLNIAAGAAAGDNVWKATCSAWADQSGNGKDYSQGTAAAQPIITVGLNGKAGLVFDGVNDTLTSALNLPTPTGGTPTFVSFGARQITWVGAARWFAGHSLNNTCVIFDDNTIGAPAVSPFNGILPAGSSTNGAAVGSWVRGECLFANSSSDYLKLGSVSSTPAPSGGSGQATGRDIAAAAGVSFSNIEILWLVYLNAVPSSAALAAVSAAAQSFYGPSVGI